MEGLRLVLVPCPFQGHINPMLQLATVLHSKGFSITIVHTKYNSPDPLNYPAFTFQPIPDGLSDQDVSSGDYTTLVLILNANCKVPFQECLSRIVKKQEEAHQETVACVVYDELMYLSEAVAKQVELPSIIFRTNSAATFVSRARVLQLIADGSIPFPDSALENMVPEHHPLRFKDLPTSNFSTQENFVEAIKKSRNIGSSSAIIWNTTEVLEMSPLAQLQDQCHVPIFAVGPMHKFAPAITPHNLLKEDSRCIAWLDKQTQNSVLYVSLGSLASMDQHELLEMAWGLANSQQPFLWVVRPGSIPGSKWIELLPEELKEAIKERGHIVKWAPQKEVLSHVAVGGFWTHCGWNSTLESICEGVPMICRPIFGDQKVTARYASQVWKVGLQLETNYIGRGEVEKVVRRVMVDKEGVEIRKRAMEMKEKVENCVMEGGSSYIAMHELVKLIISI